MKQDAFKNVIAVAFSDDDLKNLLISAVEGGSGYWAAFRKYDPDLGKVEACEHNDTRDKRHWGPWQEVTMETICRGLERAAAADPNEGGRAFAAFMKDRTGDASVADNILQLGLLGKLVYG